MHFEQQFNAMIDALSRGNYSPSGNVQKSFQNARFVQAKKALQSRNLLVAATGNYLNANNNASFTTFTPPLGFDVIVFGCSLSSDIKPTTNAMSIIRGEIRIRPPQPLSDNHIQPQKAFAPGTYSIYFPVPFVLEAGDQIATDFGFNAPQAENPAVDVAEQQIIYFCLQVKDCLDSADNAVLDEIKADITNLDYQRKYFLPCTNLTQSTSGANGWEVIDIPDNLAANAITRPLSQSVLVLGFSLLNSPAVRLAIGDSSLQHSFTLGQLVKSPNLFWAYSAIEPGIPGPFYSYFRFPMPHLLRQGSQLTCQAIAGLSGPPDLGTDFGLTFECITV